MESQTESRKPDCCGCASPKLWGAFLLVMALMWGLALSGVIAFNFWPYIGVLALVFVGIGMLLPREGAGRTL